MLEGRRGLVPGSEKGETLGGGVRGHLPPPYHRHFSGVTTAASLPLQDPASSHHVSHLLLSEGVS